MTNSIIAWGPEFVGQVAGSWITRVQPPGLADQHVSWARDLAYNVGAYNLALALGLAWTARLSFNRSPTARPFLLFFSLWLLIAALAAYQTDVMKAFLLQGGLGALLLIGALLIGHRDGEGRSRRA